jgi:hypothetical protein
VTAHPADYRDASVQAAEVQVQLPAALRQLAMSASDASDAAPRDVRVDAGPEQPDEDAEKSVGQVLDVRGQVGAALLSKPSAATAVAVEPCRPAAVPSAAQSCAVAAAEELSGVHWRLSAQGPLPQELPPAVAALLEVQLPGAVSRQPVEHLSPQLVAARPQEAQVVWVEQSSAQEPAAA